MITGFLTIILGLVICFPFIAVLASKPNKNDKNYLVKKILSGLVCLIVINGLTAWYVFAWESLSNFLAALVLIGIAIYTFVIVFFSGKAK